MLFVDDGKAAVLVTGGHAGLVELDAVKPVSSLFELLVAECFVMSLIGCHVDVNDVVLNEVICM